MYVKIFMVCGHFVNWSILCRIFRGTLIFGRLQYILAVRKLFCFTPQCAFNLFSIFKYIKALLHCELMYCVMAQPFSFVEKFNLHGKWVLVKKTYYVDLAFDADNLYLL